MSCKHKYTYIGAGEWECNLCREVVDKSDHISWVFESQSDRIAELEASLSIALRAICLTRDYVGESLLPPISGWEWYDAGQILSGLIPEDEWTEQFNIRVSKALEGKQ